MLVTVEPSTCSLNTALGVEESAIPVAPAVGLVLATVGGVVSVVAARSSKCP